MVADVSPEEDVAIECGVIPDFAKDRGCVRVVGEQRQCIRLPETPPMAAAANDNAAAGR